MFGKKLFKSDDYAIYVIIAIYLAADFEKMYVLRVPLEEEAKAEVILGDDFEDKKTFDAAGFEPYVGIWRMDDFISEDGVIPSHSRNMWIGVTDEQELKFMDNDEYSGFPFMLSTSDIDDEWEAEWGSDN